MEKLYVTSRDAWRQWLTEHHASENGIWLIFYKKGTGKPTISYDAAVEEALCFGWIDSIIKSIDHETYMRKFTSRKERSCWSSLNRKRVQKMIQTDRMTEAGLSKINAAKNNGQWEKDAKPTVDFMISREFSEALEGNTKAKENFYNLSRTSQKQYIVWINMAKRPETRKKRILESMSLLMKGKTLGLK